MMFFIKFAFTILFVICSSGTFFPNHIALELHEIKADVDNWIKSQDYKSYNIKTLGDLNSHEIKIQGLITDINGKSSEESYFILVNKALEDHLKVNYEDDTGNFWKKGDVIVKK